MTKKSSGPDRAGSSLPAAGSQSDDSAHEVTRSTTKLKSFALVDNHVVYCGDNLEQLFKRSYKIIIALTVKEILDEHIDGKLA
jgi:hypothetical protein